MIKARFFEEDGKLTGFEISGHSMFSESGSDIVCSAVSSAAIMAANTITEIYSEKADIKLDEGYLCFKGAKSEASQGIVKGLKLHLEELQKQYPKNITVS